jgi:hypothetical protein
MTGFKVAYFDSGSGATTVSEDTDTPSSDIEKKSTDILRICFVCCLVRISFLFVRMMIVFG